MERRSRRHGASARHKLLLKVALILPPALLLLASTISNGIAEVLQTGRAQTALIWSPMHAGSSARLAHAALASDRPDLATRLAQRALARTPLEAKAYSALALANEAENRADRARTFMELAHRTSRQEALTETWLIKQAVFSADYAKALRHFDIAVRTSARLSSDLLPLLVAATADERMVRALIPLLERDPAWKSSFLMTLAINGPNPRLAMRISQGRLNANVPQERAVLTQLIQRLVNVGDHDAAWSLYRRSKAGTPDDAASRIRDADYSSDGFPPFDWQLRDEPDLGAIRERRSDGRPGYQLSMMSQGGRRGEVARQLVRLQPRPYRLRVRAGAMPSDPLDRPEINLVCVTGTAQAAARLRPPVAGSEANMVGVDFQAPASCSWHVLTIQYGSGETLTDTPWLADLAIEKR